MIISVAFLKQLCFCNLFASFIYNSDFELIMGKQEQELTEIISAIRLGRAIRKHSTLIKERKDIFISWKQR